MATLCYDEFCLLTKAPPAKDAYEKEIQDLLKGLKSAELKVTGATIEQVVFVPASDAGKVKKDMVLAMVKPVLSDAKRTEQWLQPLYFVPTSEGWKLSPRK